MSDLTENIIFVLVHPIEPGNIGSACRAIKNMGFERLRVVTSHSNLINKDAIAFAHNAEDVLNSIEFFASLQDAIADAVLTVGTTRRKGKNRNLAVNVKDAVKVVLHKASFGKVAIIFGREDRGLTNEEIERCGLLLYIPCSETQPSLNLAHAVLIVAYELFNNLVPKTPRRVSLVTQQDLRLFYQRMSDTLKALDYKPSGDKATDKTILKNLCRFIGRAGIYEWELNMLHGLLSAIDKKIKNLNRDTTRGRFD